MAFRVELQPQAIADLDEIAAHLQSASSFAVAQRWFNAIIDDIATLRTLPTRCPLAPESSLLGQEIRWLLHGKRNRRYKIYFTVSPKSSSSGTVHVLHIRHWARQPVSALDLDLHPPE